ncbi:hypothetical protein KR009_010111 [Drosophila setifemur]|nr:hypothetical protein KR009_010111 [Drosophila setifemur]
MLHLPSSICISSVRIFSPSSAPSAPASDIDLSPPSSSDPEVVGSMFTYNEGLLHPFMGLLPVERSDDPWRHRPYDLHHALVTGGGSYAAYLKDETDGRRRRDTHIMGQSGGQLNGGVLTPGMLERLLRIKIEFQRRFPHLYKGMLAHQTNQTRVEVKPPVLGRISKVEKKETKKEKEKEQEQKEPIFELGAAERSIFGDDSMDPLEKEPHDEEEEDREEQQQDHDQEQEPKEQESEEPKERNDNDIDYFSFDDDDEY